MENKKEFALALVIIAIVAAAIGGYIFMQNSDQKTAQRLEPQSNGQAGVVAMLGESRAPQPQVQSDTFTPEPVETTQPQEVVQEEAVETDSIEPYSFKLPEGWDKKESKKVEDSCVDGKEALVDTYKKGLETIKVYENTRPGGCSSKTIADVELKFSYTADGESIEVDGSSIEQCSKEDNEACPKGDGRVSVYIRNSDSVFTPNQKTGNSYFIEIVDTEVDASLEKQVKALSALAELLKF